MLVESLNRHLPTEIVRYILSFDDRIAIRRNGAIRIVKKLDADKYKEVMLRLIRNRRPTTIGVARATIHRGEITTWCTARLRDDLVGLHYLDCRSDNRGITYKFTIWRRRDSLGTEPNKFTQTQITIP
jgi:hypothetical protein